MRFVLRKVGWLQPYDRESFYPEERRVVSNILMMEEGEERCLLTALTKEEAPRVFQECLDNHFLCNQKVESAPHHPFPLAFVLRHFVVKNCGYLSYQSLHFRAKCGLLILGKQKQKNGDMQETRLTQITITTRRGSRISEES